MDDPGEPDPSDLTWSTLADSDFIDRHHHHHILSDFGWTDLGHPPSADVDEYQPSDAPSSAPLSSASGSASQATHASASSSSSEDPPEKSGTKTAPSPEIPSKMVKKKGKKRVRQQRFAFMTKSEVDHLEDGYRWRKYGQKAVKNSPFPRSYYRCTNSKCTVKKRVERSSEDPTMVITTYEGQHCHHTVGFQRSAGFFSHEGSLLGQFPPPHFFYQPPPPPPPGMQFSPHDSVSLEAKVEESPPEPPPPPGEGLLGDIVPPRMRNP